ncbi:DUF3995 domain-containing protein [Lederbergia wuyishanensis]|uniref:DUF3995 domain-containing protein n=1 Tax=Lederbergia wuyishanensis TaxID=1347903 RepID=A0ABU0D3V0_9BACI|nr:DUF3995 domain-containing protein [Lederbergia wuyishanensis]MCJ8007754.1 DUF3995 domain-containing protein [Lederbergia wuyishanensis]MDQ0343083.1 hypothetical protein [Lederbergia wuyishanensis]
MYKSKEKLTFEEYLKKSVWPAYVGCIWAILYAVFVRFLEAAGGGIISTNGQFEDPEALSMASYIAGVVIMFCGFCLLGLVKPWGKIVPLWIPMIGGRKIHPLVMLIPTLFGTAFLLAHAISGMLTKTLFLAGIININFPGWVELNAHSLALWDLFFYEPWFLIMGLLAGLSAAHYALTSTIRPTIIKRFSIYYLLFVLLLIILFVVGTIVKL